MSDASDQTGDQPLPRPQDQEPAEGSRETVEQGSGATGNPAPDADRDDDSMGGSSDGDTGA